MSIDVNKLRLTGKQVSGISGYTADNKLGSGKGMACGSGPDVNKLRTTSKQVSSIGGMVRGGAAA